MTDRPITWRVSVALLVVSAVAMGLAAWSGIRTQAFNTCQAGVNEQLIVAQRERAGAADQDRKADVEESSATATLIQALFNSTTKPSRVAAYQSYRDNLDRLNAQRAVTEAQRQAHPLPALPSETCG